MRLKSKIFLFIATIAILTPVSALAGWGDALKQAGSEIATQKASEMGLSTSDAVTGVKEVLTESATSAVNSLGTEGGFMDNALAKISLPDALSGLSGDSGGLVASMNKAAESVIPESSSSIFSAIKDLAVPNPKEVASSGGDDSITRFFEEKSRPTLKEYMSPLMEKAMQGAGVGNYLDTFSTALSATGSSFDIGGYMTDKTLDGIFTMMADKEKSLRSSTTSELLQQLF